MKKIGVLLSGCGFLDGSEIHETVLTLLAISKAGAEAHCIAPNMTQHEVVNHYSGEVMAGESRNVLVESARIARGVITDLEKIDSLNLDALILPGGYGAAKNLSNFNTKQADCEVDKKVAAAIQSFFEAGKPLGFLCIAPVIAAKVLGKEHIELTIGNDQECAKAIEAMGARHVECPVWSAVVSQKGKVTSTPAYMLGTTISEVAKGIDQLVDELLRLL